MHGSPYHVYPTQNYPTQAFQNPGLGSSQGHSSINASPLPSTKSGMNQQHHLVNIKRCSQCNTNVVFYVMETTCYL